jgi:hypothetical protein
MTAIAGCPTGANICATAQIQGIPHAPRRAQTVKQDRKIAGNFEPIPQIGVGTSIA